MSKSNQYLAWRGFFWALSALLLAVTIPTLREGSRFVGVILGAVIVCLLGMFWCFFRVRLG